MGETTRLHRIALPLMCAVVPDSASDVSVFNGRGETRDHALIGAVMEAVERQTAAVCGIPDRPMRCDLAARRIDLAACGLRSAFAQETLAFVNAHDLLTGDDLDVPKALVQMPWRGAPAFPMTHTNGLACGFTFEEAVYHALLELVERHLYAITHARAHLRPKRLLQDILGAPELPFIDDRVDEIAQPTGVASVDAVCGMLAAAGLRVRLVAMRAPPLPLGILAGIHDPERADFRAGLGCSWSPAVAVVRALTEAVQGRAADIQAARENILRAADPPSRFLNNTRRQTALPRGRWYFDSPTRTVRLQHLCDASTGVLACDLHALVIALGTLASRIAIVDLSPEDNRFFAVRAIVPELETLLIDGRIGRITRAIIEDAA